MDDLERNQMKAYLREMYARYGDDEPDDPAEFEEMGRVFNLLEDDEPGSAEKCFQGETAVELDLSGGYRPYAIASMNDDGEWEESYITQSELREIHGYDDDDDDDDW